MIRQLAIAIALFVATGTSAGEATRADLLDRSRDEVVREAFIPSARNVHGEFRMIRRGEATCAQTLLYTTSLRRAVRQIRKKERRFWPGNGAGHEDSTAYLEALEQAKDHVLEQSGETADGVRRQTMAIEFILAPDAALFVLYELDLDETDGRVAIASMRPIVVRDAAPDYVRRAITLMEQSAFDGSGEDEP